MAGGAAGHAGRSARCSTSAPCGLLVTDADGTIRASTHVLRLDRATAPRSSSAGAGSRTCSRWAGASSTRRTGRRCCRCRGRSPRSSSTLLHADGAVLPMILNAVRRGSHGTSCGTRSPRSSPRTAHRYERELLRRASAPRSCCKEPSQRAPRPRPRSTCRSATAEDRALLRRADGRHRQPRPAQSAVGDPAGRHVLLRPGELSARQRDGARRASSARPGAPRG